MRTKPFVRVLGKEMILWLIEKLALRSDDVLVIVYNPAFSNIKVCMQSILLPKLWERVRFVELAGPTRGAAETVLKGVEGLEPALRRRPIMLCDGDTFYTADIITRYRAVAAKKRNGVFCFEDKHPKPIYSYIKIDEMSADGLSGNRLITDVKEKVKISDFANSGCYCFHDGNTLAEYCVKIIDHALTQKSQDGVGEFYTSGVIKAMIDEKHPFEAILLQRSDMQVLGTPQQVIDFCKEWPEQPALRFIFDLDNTLGTAPKVPGDYTTCKPIAHTIAYLRQVKAQGHTVVIATARRMRTHKHNVAAVVADIGKLTMDWLEQHDIPYDEIYFGKPWGHFYLGDLAVCPYQGDAPLSLAKQTGFYETAIKARKVAGGAGPGVVVPPGAPIDGGEAPAARAKQPKGGLGGSSDDAISIGATRFALGVGVGIAATMVSQALMKATKK